MSGINYDKIKEHAKEVKSRERSSLDFKGVKTENDFFEYLHKNEVRTGKEQIRLYALSVPINYSKEFISTVYDDFLDKTPQKLRISHITSFAHKLKNYQHLFFGEGNYYDENRSRFVKGAHELSVLDNLIVKNFDFVIGNYALLLGCLDDDKLDFYRQKILRARELNSNFVCPFSSGLVAILQNLSLPKAQVFTSEAFELLKAEEHCTLGLSEASSYITLQTKSSLKRFGELLNS